MLELLAVRLLYKMYVYVFIQVYVYTCIYLQLVELSKAQDVEAGDGTTTVVIIAGSLLSACHKLLEKGWPYFLWVLRTQRAIIHSNSVSGSNPT